MYQLSVTVSNPTGLHARPAQKLVNLSKEFSSEIRVITPGGIINPKSIFSVLKGAVRQGTVLSVEADGNDEKRAVEAIVQLIKALSE